MNKALEYHSPKSIYPKSYPAKKTPRKKIHKRKESNKILR